ncbi:MAG: hypothetical protein WBW88_00645, partial [Rhodothermales bacterium]
SASAVFLPLLFVLRAISILRVLFAAYVLRNVTRIVPIALLGRIFCGGVNFPARGVRQAVTIRQLRWRKRNLIRKAKSGIGHKTLTYLRLQKSILRITASLYEKDSTHYLVHVDHLKMRGHDDEL